MKLTTKTRYATRAMVDLANQPKGEPTPLAEIAARQEVKLKYMEQIFFKLHQAGLISSKKGPGGGYFIDRDPKKIRLSEIMKAVGETRAPVFCVERAGHKRCFRKSRCPTRPFWQELGWLVDKFFNTYTLDDICRRKRDFIRTRLR